MEVLFYSDCCKWLVSLALPDPLCAGAYLLEIISAVLRGSGIIHRPKKSWAYSFCWTLINHVIFSLHKVIHFPEITSMQS